jgi:hypothetical protein
VLDSSPAKSTDIKELTLSISSDVIQDKDKEKVKTNKLAKSPIEKELPISILPNEIQNNEKLSANKAAISAEEIISGDATDDKTTTVDNRNISKKEGKKVTIDQNITSKHKSEKENRTVLMNEARTYKPYIQPSKPERVMATFGQGNIQPVVPNNLLKTFNARAPLAEVCSF